MLPPLPPPLGPGTQVPEDALPPEELCIGGYRARLPHAGEVQRARYMPQAPTLVATKSSTGAVPGTFLSWLGQTPPPPVSDGQPSTSPPSNTHRPVDTPRPCVNATFLENSPRKNVEKMNMFWISKNI